MQYSLIFDRWTLQTAICPKTTRKGAVFRIEYFVLEFLAKARLCHSLKELLGETSHESHSTNRFYDRVIFFKVQDA